jgi:uncharacterized protein (UPF0305 family)
VGHSIRLFDIKKLRLRLSHQAACYVLPRGRELYILEMMDNIRYSVTTTGHSEPWVYKDDGTTEAVDHGVG